MHSLVLSLFPGIDLLGRGFAAAGYCVVRGPELLHGDTIVGWHPLPGRFDGVIGGPPCQDFSSSRRSDPTGAGLDMIEEYRRVVTEAAPDWWLMENVPAVPTLTIPGYVTQRLNLAAAEFGLQQRRLRTFQFGSRSGIGVVIPRSPLIPRASHGCAMASEGQRSNRRSWSDFCELQGLPRDFSLPGMTMSARYRAVGNGVPIPMARAVAEAIAKRDFFHDLAACACDCGRPVPHGRATAGPACRKRLERRRRVTAGEAEHRCVTNC